MLQRHRSTADLSLPVSLYETAVATWLTSPPIVAVRMRLGPAGVSRDPRSITPTMLENTLPLLDTLINGGVTSGVIQPSKLQLAVKVYLSRNPMLLSPGENPEIVTNDCVTLVLNCFSMMRHLIMEDRPGERKRAYQKTGGFRRKCSIAQWQQFHPLLDMMHDICVKDSAPSGTSRSVSPAAPLSDAISGAGMPSDLATMLGDDEDDHGFPLVFKKFLASHGIKRQQSASPATTCHYDSEGFPLSDMEDRPVTPRKFVTFDDADRPVTPQKSSNDPQLYEPLAPIVPSSRSRRAQVLSSTPVKKRPARAPTSSKKQRPMATDSDPRLCSPLIKARICCTDSPEGRRRAEIIGFIAGDPKKIHIATFWEHRHGEDFASLGHKVFEFVNTRDATKIDAQSYVKSLLPS